MIKIKEVDNLEQIYKFQMGFHTPYFFTGDVNLWEKSFMDDIDGDGRTLFKELHYLIVLFVICILIKVEKTQEAYF